MEFDNFENLIFRTLGEIQHGSETMKSDRVKIQKIFRSLTVPCHRTSTKEIFYRIC